MTRISTIRLLRVYTPDSVFDIIPAQNTLLCQDNVNVVLHYRHKRFALSRACISTADEDGGVFPLTVFLNI
ncbi:hypothetical protein F2P79_001149 [Pimephales promelas]|nr:hypothetical protein F2P79_001149 [Pimephales promelas]